MNEAEMKERMKWTEILYAVKLINLNNHIQWNENVLAVANLNGFYFHLFYSICTRAHHT